MWLSWLVRVALLAPLLCSCSESLDLTIVRISLWRLCDLLFPQLQTLDQERRLGAWLESMCLVWWLLHWQESESKKDIIRTMFSFCMANGFRSVWPKVFVLYGQRFSFCRANGFRSVGPTVFALYGQRCLLFMANGIRSVWPSVFALYGQWCSLCMANCVRSVWLTVFVLYGQRCSLCMANGVRSLWPTVFALYGQWCRSVSPTVFVL